MDTGADGVKMADMYMKVFWPEIMYSSFERNINSYYTTGLKDDYSWSGVPLE